MREILYGKRHNLKPLGTTLLACIKVSWTRTTAVCWISIVCLLSWISLAEPGDVGAFVGRCISILTSSSSMLCVVCVARISGLSPPPPLNHSFTCSGTRRIGGMKTAGRCRFFATGRSVVLLLEVLPWSIASFRAFVHTRRKPFDESFDVWECRALFAISRL